MMMFEKPTPIEIVLEPSGPDVVMSVAAGPSGSFYIAGYTAATPTGTRYITVAKVNAAGALDTTFGDNGKYVSELEFKGGNDEIDVVVQSDGKIVVAGTIANDGNADDRDVGLFRVDANGDLDAAFGSNADGTSRVNLTDAFDDNGTLKAFDALRGLALGPNDQLFIHAVAHDSDDADTDFTVARLTALGVLDTTYGTGGMHFLEINESNNAATPRGLKVLSDGSVIAGGYARTTASGDTVQPVLYKVLPDGSDLDDSFATGGLFHEQVLTIQTEVYNFAIDGNNITTAGYGRESGNNNVWVVMRFNLDDGARNETFGGTTNGVVEVDPAAGATGSNCRNIVGLPGGKVALLGSTGGGGERNAAAAILNADGSLDTSFGTGVHTWDFGGGEDQFWGGAVNDGKLFIAGWKGFGNTQTETDNDNAHAVVFDVQ